MSELAEKERIAIERLKAFEPDEPYYLCYSGGKDSDVIRILAQLANVKHELHHNLTSVDAPETVRYVKSIPDMHIDIPHDRIAYVTLYFSGLFAFTQFFFQNQTYRGEHYSIPFSAFLILTARYSLVGKSILKRPLKLPTFSTVMFHVSIMSTVYKLLSSI